MVGADVNFPIEIAPFEGHSLIFGGGNFRGKPFIVLLQVYLKYSPEIGWWLNHPFETYSSKCFSSDPKFRGQKTNI